MKINIHDNEKVTIHADAINCCGLTMDFGGTPSWENSDDNIATISTAGDGLSCEVTAVSAGSTDVTVSYGGKSNVATITVDAAILDSITSWNDVPVSQ